MTANLTLTYGSLNLTASPYLVEFGLDTGAPENTTDMLAFMFQDGEVELSSRSSNRTIQFNVLIEGASLSALATAEAALVAETEAAMNTLTVNPGDGSPATVFDVFRGQVTLVRDDSWELARMRRYTLTVRALPFPHSTTQTVTAALPADGVTTTLVNDGSATTGWTGAVDGSSVTPTVTTGRVKVTNGSAVYGTHTVSATLTTSITTSTTKYLVVDWTTDLTVGTPAPLRAFGDGVELTRIAEQKLAGVLNATTTFLVPSGVSSIAALRLDSSSTVTDPTDPNYVGETAQTRSLYVDNINRTDIKPNLGTSRQIVRRVLTGGSAPRQPISLALEHATNALGDALIYVYPDTGEGYVPSLRRWRIGGGATVTTDATTVSGARDAINAATSSFGMPVSRLVTGTHLLMIRAGSAVSSAAATFSWTVATMSGSITFGDVKSGSLTVAALPSSYSMIALGVVNLPTVDVSDQFAAQVRVTITASSASGVNLDEAWLFNRDAGRLIGPVACGTGTGAAGGPSNRLFVEPPSASTPRPQLLVGNQGDRSNAFFPAGILSGWESPVASPGAIQVFHVASGTLDAGVTVKQFNRWHTNAAS